MKTFQHMLSIPPKGLLEVVYPLGNMDSYDVPLVDDADLELVVKLLDALKHLCYSPITSLYFGYR